MLPKKTKNTLRKRLLIASALAVLFVLMSFAALDIVLNKYPGIGAQGIDLVRLVAGDKVAAQVESTVFQAEDILRRWQYQIAGKPPSAPWSLTTDTPVVSARTSAKPSAKKGINSLVTNFFNGVGAAASNQGKGISASPAWNLADIPPLGTMAGEGQWSPYLYDASGQVIAMRTFLQPDPKRPYALVAVVAFDLSKVRLHFVPGIQEPVSPVQMARPGTMSPGDLASGLVVAAFNGGFKAQHGHFGAMSDNVVLIPPRDGLGTVGIYNDGQVRIGAWGTDIQPSPDLMAWRQNGPLIIQDGVVNPHTADNAPQDWGYTVAGSITTFRSALGISQDGKTLFYAAGGYLTLPAVARAFQAAGAYQAIQLDINNYYVHFEAIHYNKGVAKGVPLLDSMHGSGDGRFLKPEPRDFFYVTTLP